MQKDLQKNYEVLSHAIPSDEESTSSLGELLIHRMQLLHEEPVFVQRLVLCCIFDRTKHTETLVCEAQESQGPCIRSNKDAVAPAADNLNSSSVAHPHT
jgi:hypothetical protein